jgi:CO dehydrogenase maturation factor
MTKEAYLEVKLNDIIAESKGLDLVTMGRGEGAKCYCYPNLLLRKFMDNLADNYAYMVLDNEAGMEHLSRRTTQNVDELLLISNHSVKGIRTIARLRDLVKELQVVVKRQSVIINMVPEKLDPLVSEELDKLGLEPAAIVPLDERVYEYDLALRPLLELPEDARSVRAINSLMTRLLKTEKVIQK